MLSRIQDTAVWARRTRAWSASGGAEVKPFVEKTASRRDRKRVLWITLTSDGWTSPMMHASKAGTRWESNV